MKSLPRLSPTSYALLGLLARGPATAYELNNIMQTSMLRVFWPRADSHIYSEPKKLLSHGLVSEEKEKVKGRDRTNFTITAAGRDALAAWLAEPDAATHRNQAEFMLKVILAEGGSPDDIKATLARALETTRTETRMAIAGIQHIIDSPEAGVRKGMPWNGMAANLMADILIARLRWAEYATEAAAAVPDDSDRAAKEDIGLAAYQRALQRLQAELDP
ncbi:PadR family transcriptional regulator [Halioglobus maricola]|uniref:PadR family transcriptional regulator n=1 Tax=Halioglobus maricola TaxID=2601894 RepID=A0A5P9NN62_9GAMM|nr:PadR family transcriptional regulator [Halioglobus maricola]QFU77313.1 PadR family transcriptional regulator [Halioglobus maricola]